MPNAKPNPLPPEDWTPESVNLPPDDPQGRKPVRRLICALMGAFGGSALLGILCVNYILSHEPEEARALRYIATVIVVAAVIWGAQLYRDYRTESKFK